MTIMRGIPGSGKSTYVRDNRPNAFVCSADAFHTGPDGVYRFDRDRVKTAHDWCLKQFLAALHAGEADVVVDNTNVRVFEVAPYYRLAEAFGRHVEVVWLLCPPAVGSRRNVHGVPPETVAAMANSFEPLPAWWGVTQVAAV